MADNLSVRTDLAIACRALALHQMQEGIYNHCSAIAPAKSNTEKQVVLLPPYGVLWQDLTPDCFLGVDLNSGKVVEGDKDVSPFGICIHLPIYRQRPDVKAIMHVHSDYGTALGGLKDHRLKMSNQSSCRFYNDITYYPYKMLLSESKEGEEIAKQLGDKRAIILLHHGLLSAGPSVAVAFDIIYGLEKVCKIQILAMSSGQELVELDEEVRKGVRREYDLTLDEDSRLHLNAYKNHFSK